MELRQLESLILLSEELSFTRAAARGNIAQPALSRQIRKLEQELGLPLVDRTTRRVRLTPAGADLAERARRILGEVAAARNAAQRARQLLSGRVVLGVTRTSGSIDVPGLLAAFHTEHPEVDLAVREDLSVVLGEMLRADRLDLALVTGMSAPERRQLELTPLVDDELMLAVPSEHPLARRRSIQIMDLRDEGLIAFPRGGTIRTMIETAAQEAGFVPHVSFEISELTRTLPMVAAGLGIAILPRPDVAAKHPYIVAVPIRHPGLRHELFLARRSGRALSPAAAAMFSQTLRLADVGGDALEG
jgi:DNA-binding transcriptional LysR family regulator